MEAESADVDDAGAGASGAAAEGGNMFFGISFVV